MHWDAKKLFQILPFYNTFIEKPEITLDVSLSKIKNNKNIEYLPAFLNSTSKTVINSEFSLDQSFQEILYRIDNWINQRSGWIIESIEEFYLNVSS